MKTTPILRSRGWLLLAAALCAAGTASGQTAKPAPPAASNAPPAITNPVVEKNIDLGYQALQTRQSSAAKSFFEKALKTEPRNKRARSGLAIVLIQTEQHKEALALLEPLVKDFPEDYTLKNNLAWLLCTTRDASLRNGLRAVKLAQEALIAAPNDSHVWSTLAEGYYIGGQYDKALRNAKQALQISRMSNADPKLIEEYYQQVERCRKAAETMSILE